jgi:hypothetical protein
MHPSTVIIFFFMANTPLRGLGLSTFAIVPTLVSNHHESDGNGLVRHLPPRLPNRQRPRETP